NAYKDKEFIASSDMNFRPVNSYTGPDGNLYIVDMHRGIIQQGNWTKKGSFLRNKIDSLGLAKNTGHGRIYRVVYEGGKKVADPTMLDDSTAQLVKYLGHENGWWRDNAQKEMVVRGDKSVVPALENLAKNGENHLAKIHALWTLEGLGAISAQTLLTALGDKNEEVRRAAVWISEPMIKANNKSIVSKLYSMSKDESYNVRLQLILSLYDPHAKADTSGKEKEPEIFTAAKKSLATNEDQRTYGRKLVNYSANDKALILNGLGIFKSLCASCHGADGKGLNIGGAGLAAPILTASRHTSLEEKNAALRILLHGLSGPINGKSYPSAMPAMASNNDRWIASVASYIHFEFSTDKKLKSDTAIVKPDEVKMLRKSYEKRTKPWTVEELDTEKKEDKRSAKRMAVTSANKKPGSI
ncbi:MAG: c-type cytochrome, partial [Chitinophagaceae bacterium]